ncbi:MAG: outer membrane protein [Xanthobacteraceae bacterium]
MKKLLLGTAVSLTMAAGASAADLPVYTKAPPAWSWSGCYIGANVGGGWSQLNANDSVTAAALATINGSGVVGGGQVGCDYQFARGWVIGVEGEFEAADITGSSNGVASKIPWLTTATARLGYAVAPATLLYVRGGGAWSTDDITGTPLVATATGTDNRSGWTVGGGIEHKLWSNISGFVEYNYVDFGTKNVTLTNTATVPSVKENVQEVLVGLNFRFGGPGGPIVTKY